ncbi:hypothetical protein [Tropicibacter naphthalenivorans]|uniref:Uncharacterized protein n=1 Tax=Tropicibacter naphthalenivorans TaxID=441103 RepID=A0A0P1G7K8_9RHOB|nr:hypothetical protein [Tropicibacter naphthalenivorans]CUH77567.1 hypothetical protein TRN7648_01543 [Tropicibacter naphthalenivorans]SMC56366.1 hypothetical protein SAMN04488093_10274 [Tropicibacter naphthalenivorans]
MRKGNEFDPKGLVTEAYKIDGITLEECRTIFLDWALSVPVDADTKTHIEALLQMHGQEGHPMTQVLEEGRTSMTAPRRRGGYRSRPRN